jgi:iron complex transport system substrate-binding protein
MSLAVSREAFLLATFAGRWMRYRWHRGICAAACAVALIPCAAPRAGAQSKSYTVTDETGRRMKIPTEVKRIVTLAPNLTETVYALGLGARLVGDTNECDMPPEAKLKPHVGDAQNPSLEAIVALHPDLVLATTSINRAETADALLRLGIPVYTNDVHTVRGLLASMTRTAEILGAKQQGASLIARLQQRLDALESRLNDKPLVHVLFVVWEDPLITVGQNTFVADALRWAGAESVIISKQNWPQISMEEVVRLQPDYIVIAGSHGQTAANELKDLRARPAWQKLDAVEQGHVANVSNEMLRPSPGLIDAIEQLAHQFHPEAFSAKSSETRKLNSDGPRALNTAKTAEESFFCGL